MKKIIIIVLCFLMLFIIGCSSFGDCLNECTKTYGDTKPEPTTQDRIIYDYFCREQPLQAYSHFCIEQEPISQELREFCFEGCGGLK